MRAAANAPAIPRTTHVKITWGFGLNKKGTPKYYNSGEGMDLVKALIDMFRVRGNNIFKPEHKHEILSQINIAYDKVPELSKGEK